MNIIEVCNNKRLQRDNYDRPCTDLAVYLLGKILVRKLENGSLLKGKIVETESYPGGEDKASHSFMGKYVLFVLKHTQTI